MSFATNYMKRFVSNRLPLLYTGPQPRPASTSSSTQSRPSQSTTAGQAQPSPTPSQPSPAPESGPTPSAETDPDGINRSRGPTRRYGDAPPPAGNMPSPISIREGRESEAHEGEEKTEADAQIINDPRMSTERKRENVRRAGKRALGSEDCS